MSSKINRRRFLKYVGGGLVAVAAAGGGYYFYQNFVRRPSEWDYVVLGDSMGWYYPDYYAAHIEADLGVKVKLHNWAVGDQTSSGLLNLLRINEELRDTIREAKVVTLDFGINELEQAGMQYMGGICGGADNLDCVRETLKSLRANFEGIMDEILSLRSTSDAIIRAMNYYNSRVNSWKKDPGFWKDWKPIWDALNEHMVQAASEHNIPVARVYEAFNGPNGDEDPADKGYISPFGKCQFPPISDSDRPSGLTRINRPLGFQ